MAIQVITTTVAAAESYDLISLASCKLELGIPSSDTKSDAFIAAKISEASNVVANYCKRNFVTETYQDQLFPERTPAPFSSEGRFQPLQLAIFPVQSVESVQVIYDASSSTGTVTLTAGTDFALDQRKGQLIRLNSQSGRPRPWDPSPTTVVYVGGYATIPLDLQRAVRQLVVGWVQEQGRDPYVKETDQPNGTGRITYWVPNNPSGLLPPAIADILENQYRQPVIA